MCQGGLSTNGQDVKDTCQNVVEILDENGFKVSQILGLDQSSLICVHNKAFICFGRVCE